MSTLQEKQMDLEVEMGSLGVSRFFDKLDRDGLMAVHTGKAVLDKSMQPMVEAVTAFCGKSFSGGAAIYASTAQFYKMVGYRETSFLALRTVINMMSKGERMVKVALAISQALEDELNYRQFAGQSPRLMERILDNLKTSRDSKHRRKVINGAATKLAGLEKIELPEDVRLQIGLKLLELIRGLGFIQFKTITEGKNKTVKYVEATEEMHQWLDKQNDACSLRSPVYLPTVLPPRPWTSPFTGGYHHTKMTLMKVRNRAYLEELSHLDMPMVYAGLNALQSTPWKINRNVFNVMKTLWETTGGGIAKLPLKDGKPIPSKPLDIDTNVEAKEDWKRRAAAIHKENFRDKSKRIAIGQKLWLAEKFMDEDAIYFPHTLDWRGRAYAVPGYVNPQADDSGKALLLFAEGKELGDEGVAWLAIHLANTFGYDKADFDGRIQWTEENTSLILDSAFNPLDGQRFWLNADKPFQFLAACYEWAGYTIQGKSYVSHLPVGMDGSCNGLQNFSAMLRDPVGGTYTNLVPSEKPSDIYAKVASIVNDWVQADAKAGVPEAVGWVNAEYMDNGQWVKKPIGRKLAKRNTMTRPYSVTHYGMRDQLMAEVDSMVKEGEIRFLDMNAGTVSRLCFYLADLNAKAIRQVVVAAEEAMDWLKDVAKVVASNGLPVVWTTPSGLPVRQMYVENIAETVQVRIDGVKTKLEYNREGTEISTRRQQAGISPNFVHGCDAAHMMRTIVKAAESGITGFSMIHDSYGTHAADTGLMGQILREAFVEQYSEDVLGKFREEIITQLRETGADELVAKVPELPKYGTLDLTLVLDSEYFFA